MVKIWMPITQAEVRERFDYDPASGRLCWRSSTIEAGVWIRRRSRPGKSMWIINLDGTQYVGAHIIWLYCYGRLPARGCVITHRNGDMTDNRLANLCEIGQGKRVSGSG